MKPKKRGRKPGSKNKFKGEPHNLQFWKWVLRSPEEVQDFLTRGSAQQKETIKNVLLYLKRFDPDFFEEVNGEEIWEELK